MISKCAHNQIPSNSYLAFSQDLPRPLWNPSAHVVCVAAVPVSVSASPSGCFLRCHPLDMMLQRYCSGTTYLYCRRTRLSFDEASESQSHKQQCYYKEAQESRNPTESAPQTHVRALVATKPIEPPPPPSCSCPLLSSLLLST